MTESLVNPYVGAKSFTADDKDFFFGRVNESSQLTSLIIAQKVVTFYAESGVGKTSLLQASVIPRLQERKKKMAVLPTTRVGGELPQSVNPQQVKNIFAFNLLYSLRGEDRTAGDLASLNLVDGLRPYMVRGQDEERVVPRLLILDQFEELFTTHPTHYEERAGLFNQLRSCLEEYPHLSLLLVIREDYIARLDYYAGLMPDRLRVRFLMQGLRVQAAIDAVTKPAQKAGRTFDPGVARALVDNLRRQQMRQVQPEIELGIEALGNYVEPIFLQIVCHQLWQALPADQTTIGRDDLDHYGKVDEAISAYYEGVIDQVNRDSGSSERRLRNWFGNQLITPSRTRGLLQKEEKSSGGLTNETVDQLLAVYIIRPSFRGDDTWYELTHDRLVDPIWTSNESFWTGDRIENWLRKAHAWDAGGQTDVGLLTEVELAYARQWAEDQSDDLEPYESKYLSRSQDLLDKTDYEENRLKEQGTLLTEYGWGVIFPQETDAAIVEEVMSELLVHRHDQAGDKFTVFKGSKGYRRGERAHKFLQRHGVDSGDRDWETVPYYLLIVASPQEIPFSFQYQLGFVYAVGRIHFDSLAAYARYARTVVTAETTGSITNPSATFFGITHPNDLASNNYSKDLVEPLARVIKKKAPSWEVTFLTGDQTKKETLRSSLGGPHTPNVLLTTSRSLVYTQPDPVQLPRIGALNTQDWAGPESGREPDEEQAYYLEASDIDDEAHLFGLIAFFFASNSAGTSAAEEPSVTDKLNQPHLSTLPLRLLSHPRGGALAIIGHVDQVLKVSFLGLSGQSGQDGAPPLYVDLVRGLQSGHTVGKALDTFRNRQAGYTIQLAELAVEREAARKNRQMSIEIGEFDIIQDAMIDMRKFILLGDPAARLTIDPDKETMKTRPLLDPNIGTRHWKFQHSSIQSAAWNPGGTAVLTLSHNGTLLIWERDSGRYRLLAESDTDPVSKVRWSPDGLLIAGINNSGRVLLWEPSSGKLIHKLPEESAAFAEVEWSAGGKHLALGSYDKQSVQIWRREDLQLVHDISDLQGRLLSISWSPAQEKLLIISEGETPFLIDAAGGQRLVTFGDSRDHGGIFAWSPNGEYLALSMDALRRGFYVARVWQVNEGNIVSLLRGHTEKIERIRWLPESRRLATMAGDQTTRFWNAITGDAHYLLDAHEFNLNQASFNPAGIGAIAIDNDPTARIWDLINFRSFPISNKDESITGAAISPQGNYYFLIINQRTLQIREIPGEYP